MKKVGEELTFHPTMHKQILMNWLESIILIGQFQEEDFMVLKFQFGIVKIVQNHTFQNQENTTDLGNKNVQ